MTKLFPQQRFFAIIIFISFCLHTALFISGTVKQTAKSRVYKSERILTRLSNEFAFPLVYKDRVSLSVIANSYAREYDINRIVIRDANDEILVESGIDPMLGGENFATNIKVNKTTIGNIEITLKSVSNGEIIKFLWIFIVTSLIIHVGVWFLYLSCSTPTEEDLQQIRDEVYEDFLQQYGMLENQQKQLGADTPQPIIKRPRKQAPKKVLMELADYIIEYKHNKPFISPQEIAPISQDITPKITDVLDSSAKVAISKPKSVPINVDENKVKERESEDVNRSNKIIDATKSRMPTKRFSSKGHSILFPKNATKPKPKQSAVTHVDVDKQAKEIVQVKKSILIKKRHDRPSVLSGEPPFTKLALEFKYVDKYNLLDKVMPAVAMPYFELCSHLLEIAVNQLLADKRLQGVSLVDIPIFTAKGARIELETTANGQKQLLLASTMLASLYQMINQVVYEARREAKQFAFNMNVGISYIKQESILNEFTEFNEHENVIVSLQYTALKSIKDEVIINKNTEKNYHYVNNMNEDLLLTLIHIRNNILEME